MTEVDGLTLDGLVGCVELAVAAPSVHNSQPWRFRIRERGIDVLADWSRRLEVIDPAGRELFISVGAAILNLRLAMRSRGQVPIVRLSPDPTEPDLVARVAPGPTADPNSALDALAEAIPLRHTNRRPFAPVAIPASILEDLVDAAAAEGAVLSVAHPAVRDAIFSLAHTAERRFREQGTYVAELSGWTRPSRGRHDGVPPQLFGPWDALESMPLRDFGLGVPEIHRRTERFEPHPTIAVLSTVGDTPADWLRAGQALQRVLLVATTHRLASTPMTQPLEIPALRGMVTDTASGRWAQIILRLGYGQPTALTPRRPLAEVLLTGDR
jgi:nitroreductase